MSRKNKLQTVLENIQSNYEKYSKMIEIVKNSEQFTQQYKEELIAAHKAALDEVLAKQYKEANGIIDEARQEVNSTVERAVQKLGSAEIQQQFANTLRIFELTGSTMKAEDVKTMAAPFTISPVMTNALRASLAQAGRKLTGLGSDMNDLFPLDTRQATLKALEDVQGLLDRTLASKFYYGLDGARTLIYFVNDCLDRLNDDLAAMA